MNENKKGQVKNMTNLYARFMLPAFFLMTFTFGEMTENTEQGQVVANAAEEVSTSFIQSKQAEGIVSDIEQSFGEANYVVDAGSPMSVQVGEFVAAAKLSPVDLVNPLGYLKDVFAEVADMYTEIGNTIENAGK